MLLVKRIRLSYISDSSDQIFDSFKSRKSGIHKIGTILMNDRLSIVILKKGWMNE
jgi:hypothetical protein